jgi:hypothetical protein
MRSGNQAQAVDVVECVRDILSESVSGSSGRNSPAASIIWVTPEKITHGTFVRNFLNSIQLSNLLERVQRRRQASMKGENLVLYNSCQWQQVKEVSKVFPDVDVSIFSEAFIIKAVYLSDLSALMIAS